MFFNKIPYPANYEFASSYSPDAGTVQVGNAALKVTVDTYSDDLYRLTLSHADLWTQNLCLAQLNVPSVGSGKTRLQVDENFAVKLLNAKGETVLASDHRGFFGLMGKSHVFCFAYHKHHQFYGMGEKTFGTLELSHKRSRFWNVDALGDFNSAQWDNQPLDPYYASVPYLIVRVGDEYVGLLIDNPYPNFMDTGSDPSFFQTLDEHRRIVLGCDDGLASLWILYGPSLAELTTKLQKLVGPTPLPPAWALGYHQCRWGYKGEKDLVDLDAKMVQHQIPNDGLWLDIDYMNGYRVFDYAKEQFPKGVPDAVAKIKNTGRKVVPIIDPGVKVDAEYAVYKSGTKADIFCKNPQGKPYIAFVWPGETVFPDFSLPEARAWWSDYAKGFLQEGFAGAWLDMNDPSTGSVDPMGMLFGRGKYDHGAFRNQYALGMQMASREGFQAAAPNQRVFLLSRSGFTGTSRFSAIWTGDNLATRWYLKGSIPCTLNLGLSGIPFNGPDCGGFTQDTTPELMVDWMKAGFLFPFFRIHSVANNRPQEPWAFGKENLKVLRHYIRLRYKLLPYLYNLFIDQEQEGHPILRPLLYHYDMAKAIDDQFMVGDAILQAPLVDEAETRTITLPGKEPWFSAETGEWIKPGKLKGARDDFGTPLFFRNGAIIACLPGERTDNSKPLNQVEFHVFLARGKSDLMYRFDDGETLDYQNGKRSAVRVKAEVRGASLYLQTELCEDGYGPLDASFVVYGDFEKIVLNGARVRQSKSSIQWTGPKTSAVKFK